MEPGNRQACGDWPWRSWGTRLRLQRGVTLTGCSIPMGATGTSRTSNRLASGRAETLHNAHSEGTAVWQRQGIVAQASQHNRANRNDAGLFVRGSRCQPGFLVSVGCSRGPEDLGDMGCVVLGAIQALTAGVAITKELRGDEGARAPAQPSRVACLTGIFQPREQRTGGARPAPPVHRFTTGERWRELL